MLWYCAIAQKQRVNPEAAVLIKNPSQRSWLAHGHHLGLAMMIRFSWATAWQSPDDRPVAENLNVPVGYKR